MSKRTRRESGLSTTSLEEDGYIEHNIGGHELKIGRDFPYIFVEGAPAELLNCITRVNDSVAEGRFETPAAVIAELDRLMVKKARGEKSPSPAPATGPMVVDEAPAVPAESQSEYPSGYSQADYGSQSQPQYDDEDMDLNDDDDDGFNIGGGRWRGHVSIHGMERFGLPVSWMVEITDSGDTSEGSMDSVVQTGGVRARLLTPQGVADYNRNGIVKHVESLIAREWDGTQTVDACAAAAAEKIYRFCCVCQASFPRPAVGLMTCPELFCQFRYEEATQGSMSAVLRSDPKIAQFRLMLARAALLSDRPFEPFPGNFADGSCAAPDRGAIEVLMNVPQERLQQVKASRHKEELRVSVEKALAFVDEVVGADVEEEPAATAAKGPASVALNARAEEILAQTRKKAAAELKARRERREVLDRAIASDSALEREMGLQAATALRFLLAGNRTLIFPSNAPLVDGDTLEKYLVAIPPDAEDRFQTLKRERGGSFFAFHGSGSTNWYSILCNGIKNTSHTVLMSAGAAHGNGIYLSTHAQFSCGYAAQSDARLPAIVAIVEVAGDQAAYTKSSQILVVPEEQAVVVRMLLLIQNQACVHLFTTESVSSKVRSRLAYNLGLISAPALDTRPAKNTRSAATVSASSSSVSNTCTARLMRDIAELRLSDPKTLGFEVEPQDDCLTKWEVLFHGFDKSTPLGQDMAEEKLTHVRGLIEFPQDYPFSPPFVRILSPRFVQRTGHVTYGGSICADFLVAGHGWTSSYTITTILMSVRDLLSVGGGRIDRGNKAAYTDAEARAAFDLARQTHGWV